MTKEASNFTVSLCEYVQSNYYIRNGWISFAFSLYIYVLFKLSPFVHANYLDWLRNASCSHSKFDNTWFMYTFKVQWLIDWLVFNANLSSISAILWHQCLGWLIDWCLTPTWVVFQLFCGINALDLAGKVVTFCRHHAIRKLFLPGTSSKKFKKKIPVFSYCFNWNASFSRKCQFLTLIWQRFALNP